MYCSWDSPDEAPACSAHNYEEGLIYLAHAAGVEVYPSIGGWSLSDPFPAMATNPEARKRFASQCVDLIKNYNFDGIDLDWEYPGYVGETTASNVYLSVYCNTLKLMHIFICSSVLQTIVVRQTILSTSIYFLTTFGQHWTSWKLKLEDTMGLQRHFHVVLTLLPIKTLLM